MITRSERSREKRNRIFSPGRRNRREKKLPFRLSFITKGDGGRVYPFTRFVNGEEAVLEESAGVSLVENQDIWLRFDGPPDFRFTMDGLDVVTLPHAEKIDGQSYLRPGWKGEPFLLFEGRDFPLVPGYYVITVTGAGKIWRGLLEITPKFMGRQSWQAMREELVEEIKDLSFDFMKRSIHISRSMEGELGLKSAMLLRFYAISEESDRVVQVLGELARTANSRIVRKQGVVRSNRDAAGAHIRCASGKSREGTPVLPVICSEVTWNVAENRLPKLFYKSWMKISVLLYRKLTIMHGGWEKYRMPMRGTIKTEILKTGPMRFLILRNTGPGRCIYEMRSGWWQRRLGFMKQKAECPKHCP